MRSTLTNRNLILLVAALLLVVLWVYQTGTGFPLDDSWIHQTYARNLAEYGEWAFIPGEPSAASTSPLYTAILATGYLLNIPYPLWTHLMGGLALAAAGITGGLMAKQIMPERQWASWFVGLALIGTWHLTWAATSGMETMLFSLMTLVLIHLGWREIDPARDHATRRLILRGGLFGVLAALATLTRPEGVLLAGLVGLWLLLIRPQGSLMKVLQWGIASAVSFIMVLLPYLLLNLQLTGGLLPNTAGAKFQQHAILLTLPYHQRIINLLIPIFAGAQILLIPGIVAFLVWVWRKQGLGRNRWFFLLPLVWAAALIALYAARLPAPYQHGRYVIPALPALILTGCIGVVWLLHVSRRWLLTRVASRAIMIAFALITLQFALINGPQINRVDVQIINQEMVATAHWIDANIPPDDLLAIHDIGAVGYFTPRPMLDIAGLVSPELVTLVDDDAALWDYMQAQDARYLMAFPDQIPGGTPTDPRLCAVYNSEGYASRSRGGPNMAIYRLAWDERCDT